jgi:hypothetical protein
MDDNDKSKFEEMVQTATSAIGEAAKSAVVPTQATEEEAPAEQTNAETNEQMLVGDAAIAPEAVPAPIAPKKTAAKKRKKKSVKQVAQLAKTSAKKSKKAAPKRTAKKSAKKSKTESALKKKTAKKVAKKKKARKAKR